MAPTGRPALPGCRATTLFDCSFIKAFTFLLPKASIRPSAPANRRLRDDAATLDRRQSECGSVLGRRPDTTVGLCPWRAIGSETTQSRASVGAARVIAGRARGQERPPLTFRRNSWGGRSQVQPS